MTNAYDNDSITIQKVFNSPVQSVWDAWTEPAIIMRWFGSDPKGKVLKANLDLRPGGSFEISFQDGDQTEHTCLGVYSEIEKLSRLGFSWEWKSEPGVVSFVLITLTAGDNLTKMEFIHSRVEVNPAMIIW
jgi:uncharacterized protein YndB with AHSA1/START domain